MRRVVTWLAALSWALAPGAAAGEPSSSSDSLARQYAPVLVFHPEETFFPSSPLAPASSAGDSLSRVAVAERIAAYARLPQADRLAMATVYYRVTPQPGGGAAVEYLLYYLHNPYRARGGLFPISFNISHAHDLERVVLLVDEVPAVFEGGGGQPPATRLRAVHPSAHGPNIPDNVLVASGATPLSAPPHVLVERGSHAMAPDENRNRRFEPGLDANLPRKFLWGIRDRGATWARYNEEYQDPSRAQRSLVLAARGQAAGEAEDVSRLTYRLAPVEELEAAFRALGQGAGGSEAVFGRSAWSVRYFGETPPARLLEPDGAVVQPARESGEGAAARAERGVSVGVTNLLDLSTVLVGGRWLVVGPGVWPDVLLDAQAALTLDGRDYYMADALGSYRLDATTRLLAGVGLVADSPQGTEREWDWVAGLEFRLGRLRIRQTARRIATLNRTWYEARVTYVF